MKIPKMVRRSNSFGSHKLQQVARHCSFKYTPIAYTTIADVNLECDDFEKFYVEISFNLFNRGFR
jgi:hypothetical protein